MARKRAESMDQASFWAVNAAGAPGKRCRPTMASPRPGRMIGFAPFQGFIRGMSDKFDMGVVSLKAVAEFKFVDSAADAKSALDHIYTDMKGYSGSSDWRSFYAVFYMTGPFLLQKDLDANFRLSNADRHWMAIAVQGPGTRR